MHAMNRKQLQIWWDINPTISNNTLSINCIDITHRLYSGLKRLNYTLSTETHFKYKIDAKTK